MAATGQEVSKRICVVGAGPSGLFSVHALHNLDGVEVVCYEKQSEMGGMWVFNSTTLEDPRSGYTPSSMYRELWTNGPKECLELPDFTFKECFEVPTPSFPSREVMLRYLHKYAEKFDLLKHCIFNTGVEAVTYDDQSGKFTVEVRTWSSDNQSSQVSVSEFDYVVVATGHFAKPNYPGPYPDVTPYDINAFTGKVMHSTELRDCHIFKDQRVLSIGSSYSAESIVLESKKHGCKRVVNAWRSHPIGFIRESQTDGIADEHTLPTKIEGKKVTFGDGHEEEFDMIVLCTGYQHSFPFMKDNLELCTPNEMYCAGLYKGVLLETNPKVAYIGAQDLFYSFTLFWAQAMWFGAVVAGKVTVPGRYDERVQQSTPWRERNAKCVSEEDLITIQGAHIKDLCDDFGGPNLNVDKEFLEWEHDRHENIWTHRESCFKSIFTEQMGSKPAKPWIDAWTPREFLGDEVANAINLDEWMVSVGGSLQDFRPKETETN
jgi:trimethylamine monooxygenase